MKIRWSLLFFAFIILFASGTWWYFFYVKASPEITAARKATAIVTKDTVETVIRATGNIEPISRKKITVIEKGKVGDVLHIEGDRVYQGDVLITYKQDDVSGQLNNYERSLERGQEELETLQEQYKQVMDEDARNQIKWNIQRKMIDLEEILEQIKQLEKNVPDPITAPITGTIKGLHILPGEELETTTNLGEIVDYDHMQITVRIDELDIFKVEVGQQAEISVHAKEDTVYTGRVTHINMEGNSRNGVAFFEVTIVLDDAKGLKTGMSAEATILTARREHVLVVPVDAVRSSNDNYFVQVLSGAEVNEVHVEIGLSNEEYAEVISGLHEGEEVVLMSTVNDEM